MTRELVYYILLGTLRSAQKCLGSNLRVEFQEIFTPGEAISPEASTDLWLSCKWWQWICGEILMCFLKKVPKSDHYFRSYCWAPIDKNWLSWLLANYQGQLSHSYLWGPINNSRNIGRILELFFLKHIRISLQIHGHHFQLHRRSAEASGEMSTSGVNISPKWNSRNRSMVFLGSANGT